MIQTTYNAYVFTLISVTQFTVYCMPVVWELERIQTILGCRRLTMPPRTNSPP